MEPAALGATPLLEVEGLTVSFANGNGRVRVVEELAFALHPGPTAGLVGESGSGKSVTATSIMRLIPMPPGRIEAGCIRFRGRDLLALSERDMRGPRGDRIGTIFQEPMTSLNPVFTIGFQIGEVLRINRKLRGAERRDEAIRILDLVGIGAPERRLHQYPHELSGGLRQRVMIAMALAADPTS